LLISLASALNIFFKYLYSYLLLIALILRKTIPSAIYFKVPKTLGRNFSYAATFICKPTITLFRSRLSDLFMVC